MLNNLNIHIHHSPLLYASRMEKITESLSRHKIFDRIIVIGKKDQGLSDREKISDKIEYWRCGSDMAERFNRGIMRIFFFFLWYASVVFALRGLRVSIINCHSLTTLPLCVFLKIIKSAHLIYDTRELETEVYYQGRWRKFVAKYLEKWLIHRACHVFVVSEKIADWYRDTYYLNNVTVIGNMPPLRQESNLEDRYLLRTRCNIDDPEAMVFLYQGVLGAGRGIDIFIDAFKGLDNKHLVFLGYGYLQSLIEGVTDKCINIHFLPAVPTTELNKHTSGADVGLCLIENTCLSDFYCAPNKLYQYAMNNVPVLGADFPEIRQFIEKVNCGWVCEPSVDNLKQLLQNMDNVEIEKKRKNLENSDKWFCWENEEKKLIAVYNGLFSIGSASDG